MYSWYHLHPITQFQTCQKCLQMCLLPGQQPALTLQLEILHIIEHLQKIFVRSHKPVLLDQYHNILHGPVGSAFNGNITYINIVIIWHTRKLHDKVSFSIKLKTPYVKWTKDKGVSQNKIGKLRPPLQQRGWELKERSLLIGEKKPLKHVCPLKSTLHELSTLVNELFTRLPTLTLAP